MNVQKINQILQDTAYIRTGGSDEELKCAEYIKGKCAELGLEAYLEPFEVSMANVHKAVLLADGVEIPCKGYKCSGSGEIEAPLYYLRHDDPCSLAGCRGKIVMIDTGMKYWNYHDLLDNGAVGFITYDGNINYADDDIDQKELRTFISQGTKILGVNINAKKAVELIKNDTQTVKIIIDQDEYTGHSHNVILDLPGEIDEYIVFTAHYDSSPLSPGAWDNMSGSIALLAIAEKYASAPHRYGLRIIWTGSEERGLLGAKAYVAAHEEELKKLALCINVDMIGSIMGHMYACSTCEEKLVHYVEYLASIKGKDVHSYQDVYSSDSTPFADKGVPAISFARLAPGHVSGAHNRYDTIAQLKPDLMAADIDFILLFTDQMANAVHIPVSREIPENMKSKLDIYLNRKRK